jgi:hypothetical protein
MGLEDVTFNEAAQEAPVAVGAKDDGPDLDEEAAAAAPGGRPLPTVAAAERNEYDFRPAAETPPNTQTEEKVPAPRDRRLGAVAVPAPTAQYDGSGDTGPAGGANEERRTAEPGSEEGETPDDRPEQDDTTGDGGGDGRVPETAEDDNHGHEMIPPKEDLLNLLSTMGDQRRLHDPDRPIVDTIEPALTHDETMSERQKVVETADRIAGQWVWVANAADLPEAEVVTGSVILKDAALGAFAENGYPIRNFTDQSAERQGIPSVGQVAKHTEAVYERIATTAAESPTAPRSMTDPEVVQAIDNLRTAAARWGEMRPNGEASFDDYNTAANDYTHARDALRETLDMASVDLAEVPEDLRTVLALEKGTEACNAQLPRTDARISLWENETDEAWSQYLDEAALAKRQDAIVQGVKDSDWPLGEHIVGVSEVLCPYDRAGTRAMVLEAVQRSYQDVGLSTAYPQAAITRSGASLPSFRQVKAHLKQVIEERIAFEEQNTPGGMVIQGREYYQSFYRGFGRNL